MHKNLAIMRYGGPCLNGLELLVILNGPALYSAKFIPTGVRFFRRSRLHVFPTSEVFRHL